MHRRTKALGISKKVREAVYARDKHCCILCGSPYAMPNAHYIARSQGGLGIEENIFTACMKCHRQYDNTPDRSVLRGVIREYLKSQYPDWEESKLVYRKWEEC